MKELPYLAIEHIQSTTLPGLAAKPIMVVLAFLATTDSNRDINSTVIQTFRWSTNTSTDDYRDESGFQGL